MKKAKITYYEMSSDSIWAVPLESGYEIVEYLSNDKLQRYIESKIDTTGSYFKKSSDSDRHRFGFDYISQQGAIKVDTNIKFKKIKKYINAQFH